MTVKEIIIEWLKSHKYDGLYRPEKCGCLTSNLIPCNYQRWDECKPGIKYGKEDFWTVAPRIEKSSEEICKDLSCDGVNDRCPGNPICPAVRFAKENPVDCSEAAAYMKKQIDLTLRCSFCHGENSEKCSHCQGTGKEPVK